MPEHKARFRFEVDKKVARSGGGGGAPPPANPACGLGSTTTTCTADRALQTKPAWSRQVGAVRGFK
jgi:hypothetical protein